MKNVLTDALINEMKPIREYYIPNIKLVGYGRSQVYQIECLICKKLSFPSGTNTKMDYLFCEDCQFEKDLASYVKPENISTRNYIGNIIGWVIKADVSFKNRSRFNYMKVYKRDKYQCQYCGYSPYIDSEFLPLHVDHVLPWSFRGSNKIDNLVVACRRCNLYASNKWFETFVEKKAFILNRLKEKGRKVYREVSNR